MNAAMEHIRTQQSEKPGVEKTSKRARNAQFKRIAEMAPEERQTMMSEWAEKAGHEQGEDEPCEVCRFLMEQMKV